MKLFSKKIWQVDWKCRRLWKKFCHGSKLEALSKLVSGCVKGPYCGEAEVSGCAKDEGCIEA